MKRVAWVWFSILLVLPPAYAEIYKYKDPSGVTIFTDNLADVPPDQREDVQRFKEIKSPEVSVQVQENKVSESSSQNADAGTPDGKEEENIGELQALNAEKAELDQVYEDLVRRRQAMKKEKKNFLRQVNFQPIVRRSKRLTTRLKPLT